MSGSQTTFLLAEDDENDALLVQHEMENLSYNVALRMVRDGEAAMAYISGTGDYGDRQKFPLPDVILLDLKMPKVDGFQFLEWLRTRPDGYHLIPVVVMSSSNQPQDVARAYELGANSYLTKPIGWTEFHEKMKTLGCYWSAYVEKPKVPTPKLK